MYFTFKIIIAAFFGLLLVSTAYSETHYQCPRADTIVATKIKALKNAYNYVGKIQVSGGSAVNANGIGENSGPALAPADDNVVVDAAGVMRCRYKTQDPSFGITIATKGGTIDFTKCTLNGQKIQAKGVTRCNGTWKACKVTCK